MNCYLGDKRRSYSLSQNICGALLNIMKTNYIAMAPLQYFFYRKMEMMKMNSVITRLEIEEDIIQVKLMNVEKNPLFVADVFETISREGVNIDMISSVMLEDEMRIDFTCDAKAQSALNKAIEEVKKNHPRIGVFASKNVGKLVVEGHMENEVGFASKLFKVLGDNQIPFAQVTTSEVSISYVIEKKYLKKALEKIQEELA